LPPIDLIKLYLIFFYFA